MQKTILLISQVFPPEQVVGALRVGNVARAFSGAGHRVVVVTAAGAGEKAGRREWLPGIEVHTVAQGPRYRERLTRLMRRLQLDGGRERRDNAAPSSRSARRDVEGPPRGLRGLLLSLVWVPDDEVRFVWPAYRAARRLLRDRVDLVYTSAPTHSANLVGLLLKRLHGIRWCAEFRDPWCYPQGRPLTPSIQRLNRFLERQCLRALDILVTVTDAAAEMYRERLGSGSHKVVVVRNGIPVMTGRIPPPPGAPFRIVYSGNLYGRRDPRAFLEAVADIVRQPNAPALAIDLFVSAVQSDASADPLVRELGVGHVVNVYDWVPHAEIQRVIRGADLLLVLAQRQPLQVPNKVYEYLATGVPILAVADEDGETARMLRAAGRHYLVTEDRPAAIAAAIRQAIAARDAPPVHAAVLDEWRTDRQMELLVQAVRP